MCSYSMKAVCAVFLNLTLATVRDRELISPWPKMLRFLALPTCHRVERSLKSRKSAACITDTNAGRPKNLLASTVGKFMHQTFLPKKNHPFFSRNTYLVTPHRVSPLSQISPFL